MFCIFIVKMIFICEKCCSTKKLIYFSCFSTVDVKTDPTENTWTWVEGLCQFSEFVPLKTNSSIFPSAADKLDVCEQSAAFINTRQTKRQSSTWRILLLWKTNICFLPGSRFTSVALTRCEFIALSPSCSESLSCAELFQDVNEVQINQSPLLHAQTRVLIENAAD